MRKYITCIALIAYGQSFGIGFNLLKIFLGGNATKITKALSSFDEEFPGNFVPTILQECITYRSKKNTPPMIQWHHYSHETLPEIRKSVLQYNNVLANFGYPLLNSDIIARLRKKHASQ